MKISITYIAKWQLKSNPKYKWTTCKKLINCQTSKEITKTLKNGVAGYWIGKNFIKLSDMKVLVELIKEVETPF